MSVASRSASLSLQFPLDRSNREGSVAESGDGASGPGASATPHPPPVPDHTAGIHPPPDGFHEPVDPPWGRPVEPVPPSTPAVAVGDVVVERPSVLPLLTKMLLTLLSLVSCSLFVWYWGGGRVQIGKMIANKDVGRPKGT